MKSYDPISIPFHQGWLEKKSSYIGAWRRRWVYLHGFDLYTFKEETPVCSYHGILPERRRYFHQNIIDKATEIINLSLETNPVIMTETIARPYSFQLIIYPNTSNQRIISFVASSRFEYQQWINKLQETIDIINDNKLMITKIFRDRQNMYCYYVTSNNENDLKCDDENNLNINNILNINRNPLSYTHCYQLSITDILYLCSGYIRQLQWELPCNILDVIQKYVRFELNVSSDHVNICGGIKYEYLSINIENNATVCYQLPSHIKCLQDCIISSSSNLILAKGESIINVKNRLHIDSNSNIKHVKYGNNNVLKIICDNDMIINKSNIVTSNLDINVSKTYTMNQTVIICKNININTTICNLNIIDSNIRCEQAAVFNVERGNLLCDQTGIFGGKLKFNALNGMIKMNPANDIQSNISALHYIKINAYKFILNVANKYEYHPYLFVEDGNIEITTKYRTLCALNVYERAKSNNLLNNYYWNKDQPSTWLTSPIPIFYNSNNDNNSNNNMPKIFKHNYQYPFELSLEQINDLVINEIRNTLNDNKLNNDWLIQYISSYIRWDLVFGFNFEPLKTLYLQSNQLYEYYNIKINEGYKIMIKYDDNAHDKFTKNHSLNIHCLNNMDIAGSIILNKISLTSLQQETDNDLNLDVGNTMIMRKNSNISINHYGNYHGLNHLLVEQNNINASNDDNIIKYGGKDINIECNNLIMTENCSIDSIGHHGGNITIKATENIDLYHEPHDKNGNRICSIGIDQRFGVGGDIMIQCNNLNLSKLNDTFNSRIDSIGKYKNGNITVKAKRIRGDLSNVKPNAHFSQSPSPRPSTIILY